MKFDQAPTPADTRATSVQPEASADVADAISEDLQHEASAAPQSLKTQKQTQHQAARPVLHDMDKPPKKRAKKIEHTTPAARDSDQLSQVRCSDL